MLTKKDMKYLRSLQRYAKTISPPKDVIPRDMHFALGVNKKVCVYGHNSYEPKGEFQDCHKYLTPHAESSVLKHMAEVTTLYVIRLNAQGKYMLSCPCQECMKIIKQRKVRRLVYSIPGGIKKVSL